MVVFYSHGCEHGASSKNGIAKKEILIQREVRSQIKGEVGRGAVAHLDLELPGASTTLSESHTRCERAKQHLVKF